MLPRWLKTLTIVAVGLPVAQPAAANNLFIGISYATEFMRACPGLEVDTALAMRIMSVVYGPPNNIPDTFGEAIMAVIPPVPAPDAPPYNPDDFHGGLGVEKIDCDDGLKLFGPEGTMIPGLLVAVTRD